MIETRTALANIDAIAGTPGVDGLFLGPSDLSIALSEGRALDPVEGRRGRDRPHRRGRPQGGQDSGRLLPQRRARARTRQARHALHRGVERHGLPARGRAPVRSIGQATARQLVARLHHTSSMRCSGLDDLLRAPRSAHRFHRAPLPTSRSTSAAVTATTDSRAA